jgi:hypothetical protein
MRVAVNLMLLCALVSVPLAADTPLPPPAKVVVWSENHRYFVESMPNGDTTVYLMSDGTALWKIPSWHRIMFISNPGFVAIGDDGINLLPLNCKPDVVLIELWHDGRLLHQIRLRDLVQNTKHLRRTASHYYWGVISGFNNNNLLEVITVEGRVSINPENGSIRSSQPTPDEKASPRS